MLCLLAVNATLSGQKKKYHAAARNAKRIRKDRDVRAVPDLTDVISERNVEAASNFLKKSLYEFFHGLEKGAKHSSLPRKPQKRTRSHATRRRLRAGGRRRGRIPKFRNDTDTSGRHERKCKFPFIHDGKTVYTCLTFDEADKKDKKGTRWCSTTSNYDRDMRWTYCSNDGTPVKRQHTAVEDAPNGALTTVRLTMNEEPEEAYPNLAEMNHWENEVETMAEKKTLPGISDVSDKKEIGVLESLCENCVPKNNTEAVAGNMANDEVDDVDKNDERIHNLVSKEVDNFIGSVLAKHGVPDTEQKELLALNQKLSTELAQEVSCKMSIDQKIGSLKDDCSKFNLTKDSTKNDTTSSATSEKSSANKTATISNDDLLKGEVDNFISTILSQHGVPGGKQQEIVKFIRKASTDIADQISYVVAYAKADGNSGGTPKNKSDSGKGILRNMTAMAAGNATNATKNSDSSIHTAVDNFLGLVLEKNGVPEDQQKDILRWNAQLSTDISDQVNSIVDDAKKLHEDFTMEQTKSNDQSESAHAKLVAHNKATQAMISQLKPALSEGKSDGESIEGHLNHHSDAGVDVSNEVSHMQDASKPIFKPIFHSGDEVSPSKSDHTQDKDPLLQSLYNKAHEKEEKDTPGFMNLYDGNNGKGNDAAYDENKSYDDVSTENDIEIGLDDMNINENGENNKMDVEGRGSAAEKTSDKKVEQTGDGKNMTAHYPGATDEKIRTGDADWDKYLMDNMWSPKKENGEETKSKSEHLESKDDKGEKSDADAKKDQESIKAAKEQLDEEEKNMINYVSDSIIQSVKNVQPGAAATNDTAKDKNDVEFKKLDSGKKPFSIFRVNSGKEGEATKDSSGEDNLDTKSTKVVPGAKNINIIIINNQNSSALDLNEIENTIARSGDMSLGNSEVVKSLDLHGEKSNGNKNLFLLLNTTATKEKLSNASNASSSDKEHHLDTTEKSEKIEKSEGNTEKSEKSEKLDKSIKHLSSSLLSSKTEKPDDSKQHLNFSKLLGEYAGNLAASSFSTLRKTGLINMNYAPEETIIHTFGGNANGAKCKFPFIFDGDTYFNCITGYRDKPWCSSTANYDKLPIWGFCDDKEMRSAPGNMALTAMREKTQKQEELADIVHSEGEEVISKHSGMKTYGGNAQGARCVIPFVYDGQTHMRCIPRSDGTAWCAASHSYDIHPVWGNCCDDDTFRC